MQYEIFRKVVNCKTVQLQTCEWNEYYSEILVEIFVKYLRPLHHDSTLQSESNTWANYLIL
jgi:hypothetical protein